LAVPTAALFDTTDGASLRTSNNGIVRVQVGISGDGYTEIKGSSPSIQEGEVVQLSAGAGGDK
jgi:hypothetical protein